MKTDPIQDPVEGRRDASPDPTPQGSGLRLRYILALSSVAILTLCAQVLIQHQLRQSESDSRVINVAGRQRMLSQRLAKTALQTQDAGQAGRAAINRELRESLEEWARSHRGLREGDPSLGLPGGASGAVQERFASIQPHFDAIHQAAQRLVQGQSNDPETGRWIESIQQHEGAFLVGMDSVVRQYVREAEERVARLRRLEYAILGLTLVVLLFEAFAIFRPAVRRIELSMAALGAAMSRLKEEKMRADEANAAKTRFLANVSHELRTPMTAVLGMTGLARTTADAPKRDGFLAIVEEAGQHLLTLLNDLIDLAQIETGRLVLRSAKFQPSHTLERVARIFRATGDTKGVRLQVACSEKTPTWVVGDARRIEQVLLNLVGNSLKWTDRGRVTMGCELVDADDQRATLAFTVEDTGLGIDPAERPGLFQPKPKPRRRPSVSNPTEQDGPPGAGLGLTICRSIADAMGATLRVESFLGVGTKITLTCAFPLAHAEPEASNATAVQPLKITKDRPLRVLVVEDTEFNQILMRETLERAGCLVAVASSGEVAEQMYLAEGAEVLLIDLQLPGIDGRITAQRLLESAQRLGWPRPRCVCVTADATLQNEHISGELFDGVVTKPIDNELLLRAIHPSQINGSTDSSDYGSGSDCRLYRELIDAFLTCVDPQRVELKSAVLSGRFAEARVLAHRFVGQIGYFKPQPGEEGLRESLLALESACIACDQTAADQLIGGVDLMLARLSHRIESSSLTAFT